MNENIKKIAIYGKGGIGKSTTVSNISSALAKENYTVMQIGCDPKADSTRNLQNGNFIPTVLDVLREKGDKMELSDIVFQSENGVLCVEAGGPTPGVGCAGRGIIAAFEMLEKLNAFEVYKPDIVIYDVLGDVVCGGFAMPIRNGYAQQVYIVTSGEMMSMYAASNICNAVNRFSKKGYASLKGLILNERAVENELEQVEKLCTELNTKIVHTIPRNKIVQQAEALNKTVVDAFGDSAMAACYKSLAEKIIKG